ncbi:hypothetical protein [Nonomuraea cavernae]|uniref:hypothetical protein n=1 Tax=Nonomuraea cavernae TaxID=2045107 RepID=UPI0033D10D9A
MVVCARVGQARDHRSRHLVRKVGSEVGGERGDAGVAGAGVGELVQPGVEGVPPRDRVGFGERAEQFDELGPVGRVGHGVQQSQQLAVDRRGLRALGGEIAQHRRHVGRHRRVGMQVRLRQQRGQPVPFDADRLLLPGQVGVQFQEHVPQLPALVVGQGVADLVQRQAQLGQPAYAGESHRVP